MGCLHGLKMLRDLGRRRVSTMKKSSNGTTGVNEVKTLGSDITFGPVGGEWKYTPATKTYDLTRGLSENYFSFDTSQGPEGISVRIAPKATAMVIIDMQNYFLHPSCNTHPAGLAAVDHTLRAIRKCREIGVKIIWLSWGLKDKDLDTMPAATLNSFAGTFTDPPSDPDEPRTGFGDDLGDGMGRCLMLGSWNAQLYGPLESSYRDNIKADIVCPKSRVSGLWSAKTPFAEVLQRNEFKTLLFAGVNTNQCVLGTLLDCYYQGLDCVMLEDCCGTTTPGGQDVCIKDISRGYGFVVDESRFIKGQLG